MFFQPNSECNNRSPYFTSKVTIMATATTPGGEPTVEDVLKDMAFDPKGSIAVYFKHPEKAKFMCIDQFGTYILLSERIYYPRTMPDKLDAVMEIFN